jgi:hypothetical protein
MTIVAECATRRFLILNEMYRVCQLFYLRRRQPGKVGDIR